MNRTKLDAALQRKVEMFRSLDAGLDETERAAAAVSVLVSDLKLGMFIGHVQVDMKPRFLLRFRAGDGSTPRVGEEVVLKVYGDQPRGEGPMLRAWRDRGLSVPYVRFGELDGCSWLLMEYMELERPGVGLGDRARALGLTEELAASGSVMHRPAADIEPFLRSLHQLILPRWDDAAERLRAAGYATPGRWRALVSRAYAAGPRGPLHGDLGLPNLGRNISGQLTVLDPSALIGPVEFDAVRWAARLGSPWLSPHEILSAWKAIESYSSTQHEADLLAAECVLEAGSQLVNTAHYLAEPRIRYLLECARVILDS